MLLYWIILRLKNVNYKHFNFSYTCESITCTVTHGSLIIASKTLKIFKLYVFQIVAIFWHRQHGIYLTQIVFEPSFLIMS